MKLLLKWLLSAGALWLVAAVFSGVQVQSFGTALLAVVVISLLNTLVRPVLVVLTLPVTVITVGLFLFVINGLMLWAASGLLGGLIQKIYALFFVQRQNNFTVALGFKLIFSGVNAADFLMVINFTVYGKNDFSVVAYQRLFAAQRVNNGKTFVA